MVIFQSENNSWIGANLTPYGGVTISGVITILHTNVQILECSKMEKKGDDISEKELFIHAVELSKFLKE